MKTILITLFILISIVVKSQIGVVTLDKGADYIPMNMWYTIADKDRKNQIYFTSHQQEVTESLLEKILFDYDINFEDSLGVDSEGSPYWGIEMGNGFYSWVYYTKEDNFYSIAIVTEEQ